MLANRSMPRSTVIPQLPYPDIAEATAWLTAAFGFTLRIGIGDHRAQLNAGDGAIVLTHRSADATGTPAYLAHIMVRVPNVDAHHNHAIQHGARTLSPPYDYPYGERQYTVADHAGHIWTFSQSIADVDPRDWGGTPGTL
jgi:uncharacterized glyoxalase superfamily protein PhnB